MSIFHSTSLRNLFGLLTVSAALYFGAFFAFRADSESRFTKFKTTACTGAVTGTTLTDICSISFKTTGRPVIAGLMPDNSGSNAAMTVDLTAGSPQASWVLLRGATELARGYWSMSANNTGAVSYAIAIPPSAVNALSVTSAGTYTYKFQIKGATANDHVVVSNATMYIYELP